MEKFEALSFDQKSIFVDDAPPLIREMRSLGKNKEIKKVEIMWKSLKSKTCEKC